MAKPVPALASMIVLNRRANTPSRFFLKGKGFAVGAKVFIDDQRCHRSHRVGAQLITARVRYAELFPDDRLTAPPPTGELDVTITVKNGSEVSDPIVVTVYVDDDDDVTDDA